jgi:hypothetical protein
MNWRLLGLVAFVLWITTIAIAAWLFVQGQTRPGSDGRNEIVLAPAERDMVLAEMRQLLKAVHGVVSSLSTGEPDQNMAGRAARGAGMAMAADVNPSIMMKLPLAFKQMGMSIHKDMDALADAAAQGESTGQLLQRLSSMTARCTTCHDMYRFSAGR